MKFEPEALLNAFSRFLNALGARTAGGRMMLGGEIVFGVFSLAFISIVQFHDLVELAVSIYRGVEHVSGMRTYFFPLFLGMMFFSFLALFVHEISLSRNRRR